MTNWYTLNYGAMVHEKTFNTEYEAEMFALALAVTTGYHWNVKQVCGWDK